MLFTNLKVYNAATEHKNSLRLGIKFLRSAETDKSSTDVLRIHRGGGRMSSGKK